MERITLHGKDELIAALNQVGADVQSGAVDALKAHGRDVASALRNKLPEGGGVSAPGQPPHSQDSREKRNERSKTQVPDVDLKSSIRWAMKKAELGKEIIVSVYVRFKGSNAFYGYMLEYGTSKVTARPFFWPTIKQLAPNATARIDAAIKQAVRRFNGQ
jgi:HK97 gp10 family phage protein